jgi:hypothetical protein
VTARKKAFSIPTKASKAGSFVLPSLTSGRNALAGALRVGSRGVIRAAKARIKKVPRNPKFMED